MFHRQQRSADNTLYDTLGVSRTASDQEIKRAYRRLAAQYHPDKPTGDTEKFQRINAAHEVLSDERQRRIYDAQGLAGVQRQQQHRSAGAAQSAAFEDIFGRMFRGQTSTSGHPFGGMGMDSDGSDGGPRVFTFNFAPGAAGGSDGFMFGQQMRMQEAPLQQLCDVTLEQVYARHGFEFQVNTRRRTAPGTTVPAEQKFKITFKSWNDLKRPVYLRGKGHQSADENVRDGDIVVRTNLRDHSYFSPCNQYDMILHHTIPIEDAMCGFDFEVPFIDASRTTLRFSNRDRPDEVIAAGTVFKCPCGLPLPDTTPPTAFDAATATYEQYGTLFVVLDVATPETMDEDDRKRIAARFLGDNHRPRAGNGLVPLERASPRTEMTLSGDLMRRKVEERARRQQMQRK